MRVRLSPSHRTARTLDEPLYALHIPQQRLVVGLELRCNLVVAQCFLVLSHPAQGRPPAYQHLLHKPVPSKLVGVWVWRSHQLRDVLRGRKHFKSRVTVFHTPG